MSDEPTPHPGVEYVRPHVERLFAEILAAQCAKGEAKYGTRLQTFNGRDALNDALAELVDAVQYVTQARMEREEIVKRAQAMQRALMLCHTQLLMASAFKGYHTTGPLSQPATEIGLRLGDDALTAWDALGIEGEGG